jgi:hypothetical protein
MYTYTDQIAIASAGLNPPVPLKEIESGQRNHSYYEVDIISFRGGFPNDEK